MGVHGLWDLLAPVGRRVSVETLAGKRVAIDASIWMIQFMKAMRDERGEMVRNAHLLGFFRRICKLLFLRTKPVFVFDGGTPALKRRTVIARRRQRENAQAKIRKTAEKLLLNHVKAMRLKELADNLQDQKDNSKSKGKEVLLEQSDTLEKNKATLEGHNQEMIDEMVAASILAEESGELGTASSCAAEIDCLSANASASTAAFPKEDEDDDDDEEIIPITDGDVDPAVLAALPPSMQLDLLHQMRERLMAENRQKYQKVKKAPQKFSELQIDAYLKTVAFRREIDQVQRAASGKGVGGVQTSRIASESNREFIFSSSFSGDKQLLASDGAEKIPKEQQIVEKKVTSFDILNSMASATKSNAEAGSDVDEAVQTFFDERGHRRVSRRRAMGVRMTRDLQRNIDLLKELEQERTMASIEANPQINPYTEVRSGKSVCCGKSFEELNELNCNIVHNDKVDSSLEPEIFKDSLKSESCITISFADGDVKQTSLDDDDDFFAHLVAGDHQVPFLSADNSTSDCEWEDGTIGRQSVSIIDGNKLETNSSLAQDENKNESDVEWEEGLSLINNKINMKSFDVKESNVKEIGVKWQEQLTDVHEYAPLFSVDVQKTVSKGSAEEEAALQEAIRRSLEDLTGEKTSYAHSIQQQSESCSPSPSSHPERVLDGNQQSQSTINECGQSCFLAGKDTCVPSSSVTHSTSTAFAASGPVSRIATKDLHEQQLRTSSETEHNNHLESGSSAPTGMVTGMLSGTVPKNCADDMNNDEAAPMSISSEVYEYSFRKTASALEEQTLHGNLQNTEGKDDIFPVGVQERIHDFENFASKDEVNTLETLGSTLEDELLVLGQEHKNLGDEQRKLERNADSVNAEMFVECQELLQMFGLPYIIAPMEAEAQCAYMELVNLVDGVVTDDSDVFLFGAQSVYKNIFDDRKYVETYLMKDIQSELGLNREKLIRMALLLGSDYTEGVSGIGIVNAIEVVNAFPEDDGLQKFREWIESPDPAILGKLGVQSGSSSKKKGSKVSKKGMNYSTSDMKCSSAADSSTVLENEDNESRNDVQNIKLAFMNKHRNVSKNWHIPASFPSDAVISAYVAPQVDKSTEPFAWGKPDVFSLRRLCWEKFGWASQKADELLLPVLKEYNKHETQLRLEAFYSFNERFAKIRSKRIKKAVKGITGKQSLDLDEADDLQKNSAKKKTEARAGGNKRKKSLTKSKDHVGERMNSAKNLKSQQEKGDEKEGPSTEVGSIGFCTEAEKQSLSNARSSRVRGGRSGTATGRSTRKESSDSEPNGTSIDKYNSSSDEHEHEALEKIELPDTVRRSKRTRKAANYLEEDEESDELVIPQNSMSKKYGDDIADEQISSHCPSVRGVDAAADIIVREFTSEDLSEQALPGDYLVKDGGFCAEKDEAETENNQLGSIQRDTASVDAYMEYLQMGGGFCVDDDDDLEFRDCNGANAHTPATFTETEEAGQTVDPSENVTGPASNPDIVLDRLSDSKLNAGSQHVTKDGNLSTVAVTSNDDAPTSVNPFSAIPYLKRKRRKT